MYNSATNAEEVAKIQEYLDAAATNLSAQLDVTVVRFPVAYTLDLDATGDGGVCQTHLPNSVNAAVANVGGTVKVGFPDPRFYPFRAVIESRVDFLGTNATWIITDEIHVDAGEAHCASNMEKIPPTP